MNCKLNEFEKFSISNGVNSNTLNGYTQHLNGIISPTIIEERQMNVASMDVFSALIRERIIFLGTSINADVANIINAQLLFLDSSDESDITIYINTPGGVITDGLAIVDTMNLIRSDVATTCMGMAASMGSVILSSGVRGKRSSLPHGKVLLHQPMGGCKGQASDILIEAEEIKKAKEELFRILADNSGQNIEQVWKDGDRDFWLTAEEALKYGEYGLIDKIITGKK